MKRSVFFLVSAMVAFLFGGMMLLAPTLPIEGFGMVPRPDNVLFLRSLGGLIFSAGVLNLLVRNHADGPTLRAVLVFNIVFHAITMVNDVLAVTGRLVAAEKTAGGQLAHLFIGIGSAIYLARMKQQAA